MLKSEFRIQKENAIKSMVSAIIATAKAVKAL
jgi:hypothetical protein